MTEIDFASPQLVEREAAYELGMDVAAYFHAQGLLNRAEVERVRRQLATDVDPLIGRLDEGCEHWISGRV